ncbi:MAG: prolyl oligopeptidase family serine peptidase [Polyangiaceae bacterium]|nr:prolyl oligopeptidase family serine peptidase [Polyangiaceae bacterium]
MLSRSRARRPAARAPRGRWGALGGALLLACQGGAPEPAARAAATAPAPSPSVSAAPPPAASKDTLGGLSFESWVAGGGPGERLPLVVGLHGLGDSPAGFRGLFGGVPGPARFVLFRAPLAWGRGYSWWDYRPGDGDSPERARALAEAAGLVARAIGEARERFPTAGAPIVTGFSQGGMLSFALAAHHPASIGEAIPIGGSLPPALRPATAASPDAGALPRVTALHGEADDRVPIGPARETVARLRAAGHPASLATFPGVGHSIPAPVRGALHQALASAIARARAAPP